jgi:hypothetical protein
MPSKEIKELRLAGKLDEALQMAKTELETAPDNIWAKRNISWVYYEYIKQNTAAENIDTFLTSLNSIKELNLTDEKMLLENLCWQIGKLAFALCKENPIDNAKGILLFNAVKSFAFTKPSEPASFLFKALHKLLKNTEHYIEFADWWDFKNFMPVDFNKETLANGKDIMSIAEQAYIAYSKSVLPIKNPFGEVIFSKQKALDFLPKLEAIVEAHPEYQYPPYFNAKLLFALGDKDNMLPKLLPFAKKKRNDFWVWEILAEVFIDDKEKVFACYCKALTCKSPEEMLVSLRQKMAGILISKELYNEAKTEIKLLVETRNSHSFKIPNEVVNWQTQDWYKNAAVQTSNFDFYKKYSPLADLLLFSDTPEETVIVEFINKDKKMLNFIGSESKFGYFKYEKFLKNVNIGDVLKVRFRAGNDDGMYQLYTATLTKDDAFKSQFLKNVAGVLKIVEGKTFGFVDDVYVHPSLINKFQLKNGQMINVSVIKSYNKEKKNWSWKAIEFIVI